MHRSAVGSRAADSNLLTTRFTAFGAGNVTTYADRLKKSAARGSSRLIWPFHKTTQIQVSKSGVASVGSLMSASAKTTGWTPILSYGSPQHFPITAAASRRHATFAHFEDANLNRRYPPGVLRKSEVSRR